MTALAFVDVETTGLSPHRQHHTWEIAVIRRENGHDLEYLWQRRVFIASADPEALAINRYHQRFRVPDGEQAIALPTDTSGETYTLSDAQLRNEVTAALSGAVLIGSNPGFDAGGIGAYLLAEPWHYRPLDVITLAAGYLIGAGRAAEVTIPYSSRTLSRALGIEPPGADDAHTALPDARWMRDLYDAIPTAVPGSV
ncbi:3'-5' exonuclease [Streptomyces xiamenensis]|uniref:3'-5' exonuclease n=1 Tax=Streptomyces xiamenensis TaxID=408015 RepID=UPI003D755BBF